MTLTTSEFVASASSESSESADRADQPSLPGRPDRSEVTDLVLRAQSGEPAAQALLVSRYTRRLAGYVRSIIHQPDAAEDVVQVVFIKMFRRFGRLRDPGAFESWLFRLARNSAVDFIRRRRCRPATVPVDDNVFNIPDPTDANALGEIRDALSAALMRVSATDRQLVNRFVDGSTYETLARENGLTIGAVKARMHRMRPFLRTFVGEATEMRLPSDEPCGAPTVRPRRPDDFTLPVASRNLTLVRARGSKPLPAPIAARVARNRRGGGKFHAGRRGRLAPYSAPRSDLPVSEPGSGIRL